MAERDEYEHYIRRANLALAGRERGEQVSTWVLFEHVKESVELIRSLSSVNAALREQSNKIYDDVIRSCAWEYEIRDKRIAALKAQLEQLTAWLKQERISSDALKAQLFDILSDKS